MNFFDSVNNLDTKAIVIAEAGINHDGDVKKAKEMVKVASEAGATYCKFQSFSGKKLVTPNAPTSTYIDQGSKNGESFRDLLMRLELSEKDHLELKETCDQNGIKFLSTPFDEQSFNFLVGLGIDVVKVASGNLTNIPLISHMASAGLPMIISTGMATLGEIEECIEAINKEGNNEIILLHCISWYPAEIETTNLLYMNTLKTAFGFPVGYSDHTLGINMTIAARALGATVLEKHFTLNKNEFGPDHSASIEPTELIQLVRGIREVEKGIGVSKRVFSEKELGQRAVHRTSIVASTSIMSGEYFTKNNITIKRPGTGIKPKHFNNIVGRKAKLSIKEDDLLSWDAID